MIKFNLPPVIGTEKEYILAALESRKLCGDGPFTKRSQDLLKQLTGADEVLLTTSGSTALDMAAMLCDVGPGDEVILPSYTFSTTASAFANLGANLVFVDIRPDTMNIDERLIEKAITERTRVIVPVHYAGVACDMDAIMGIARQYGLLVVEDAAQGVMATYEGRALGTIGDLGCFSFHETKNYSMGEGGALLINNPQFTERAEIIREKGTNRARFFRGQVDKYTWVDRGGSYLPSDMNAAFLLAQLEAAEYILANRMETWIAYDRAMHPFVDAGRIEVPSIPQRCSHNAHMYWVKMRNLSDRTAFIDYMAERDIQCCFHYVPLHSSPAGLRFGGFHGNDAYTTKESERLVRLPLWYGMEDSDLDLIISAAIEYLEGC